MKIKANVNLYPWSRIGTEEVNNFHKLEAWTLLRSCLFVIILGPMLLTHRKQCPEAICKKSFSSKFCNIHRVTPVLESLFNKVAGLKTCNLIKKETPTQAFSFEHGRFLSTKILKNICKRLLLTQLNTVQQFGCLSRFIYSYASFKTIDLLVV